jgi:lactate dehydrogenase-like 2-hydroxyacid dehydrogenase
MMGQSPRGKVLGIVGYGRIGRAVARRAAGLFDMRVIWYSPRDPSIADPSSAGPPNAERVGTLEELLQRAVDAF